MSKKIPVFIKPNSKQEKVVVSANGYVVFIKDPPIENRANNRLIQMVAKYLNIPKAKIKITKGFKSRRKILEITN